MERPQAMLTEVEERWSKQTWEGMETDNGPELPPYILRPTIYNSGSQGVVQGPLEVLKTL